jgi:hypothetical protein
MLAEPLKKMLFNDLLRQYFGACCGASLPIACFHWQSLCFSPAG